MKVVAGYHVSQFIVYEQRQAQCENQYGHMGLDRKLGLVVSVCLGLSDRVWLARPGCWPCCAYLSPSNCPRTFPPHSSSDSSRQLFKIQIWASVKYMVIALIKALPTS